jgi:hypothetical protein
MSVCDTTGREGGKSYVFDDHLLLHGFFVHHGSVAAVHAGHGGHAAGEACHSEDVSWVFSESELSIMLLLQEEMSRDLLSHSHPVSVRQLLGKRRPKGHAKPGKESLRKCT